MYAIKSFAVGFGIVGGVCYGGYEYKRLNNRRSLIYLGQSKAFEAQLDLHLGVPVSQMIPHVTKFHFVSSLHSTITTPNSTDADVAEAMHDLFEPANDLRAQFPRSFLGDLLAFYAARRCGDLELARGYLQQAHHVARQNPEWTQPIAHLLPPEDRLAAPSWQPVWTEIVPNRLWTISTPSPLPLPPLPSPSRDSGSRSVLLKDASPPSSSSAMGSSASATWGLQSLVDVEEVVTSVLRLDNEELVVVNPGVFDSMTTKQINELGKVTSVFVPTYQEFTPAITDFVDRTWPQARRLGVSITALPLGMSSSSSSSSKTTSGSTTATGAQLTSNVAHAERMCNDELTGLRVEGVETTSLAVHTNTGTMFGLPVLCTRRSRNQGDYPALVDFAMGQYRGALSSTPLDPPSYLWCVLADPLAFRSSVLSLIDQQATCQRIVPPQGDVLPAGDAGRKLLMLAYGWLLGPEGIDYCLSHLDQVFMQLAWVSQHRLWPVIWKVGRRFLHFIFQQPGNNNKTNNSAR